MFLILTIFFNFNLSYCFRIHTVFGRVISGIEVIKVIEDLPVDRNSRPLDEVMVKSCGELVRQTKGK